MPEELPTRPILQVIEELKTGAINTSSLSKPERQECVEALMLEGLNTVSIAQFLNVADRTIRRDIAEIRMRNSLVPSTELVKEIIGDYILSCRANRMYLMKLARTPNTSVAERAQAEYYASLIGKDIMNTLQSLGYLPKSGDSININHYAGGAARPKTSIAELLTIMDDMKQVEPEEDDKTVLETLQVKLQESNDAS